MNILADASLLGLDPLFPSPFILTKYDSEEEIPVLLKNQDILLCRSTLKVNEHLLKNHTLKVVATASSGLDHISLAYLKSQGIQLLDAKGCNAESVADYVVANLAYLGVNQFLTGNTIGIIGMGFVGTLVYSRLKALGFQPLSYDPPKAKTEVDFQSADIETLYQCDVLCLHANLHQVQPYPSLNLINEAFLTRLKPGCTLINAARGGIVDEKALLNNPMPLTYCTDVYLNEPWIDKRIINKATLCTPHIAGHSLEAKYKTLVRLSEQLHRFAKLPPPNYSPLLKKQEKKSSNLHWQERVLSLYNPMLETLSLKEARDKTSVFLLLRKNHQRHRFLF